MNMLPRHLEEEPETPEQTGPSRDRQRRNYAFMMRLVPSTQFLLDSVLLIASGLLSYHLLVYYSYKTAPIYYLTITVNWLLTVLLFHFAGLYEFQNVLRPRRTIDVLVIAIVTTFLLMIAAAYSAKISSDISRIWFSTLFALTVTLTIASRLLLSATVRRLTEQRLISRRIAIYGSPVQIERVVRHIERSQNPIIEIDAIYLQDTKAEAPEFAYPVRLGLGDLVASIREDEVDDVVLAVSWSDAAGLKSALEQLRELPTNVMISSDIVGYEVPMTRPPGYFEASHMFQLIGKPLSGWDIVMKTAMDYVLASVILVVLSPFLLLVALLIKLDSPGPVLFRQRRLGFNNREFGIFKFRSMTHASALPEKTIQATRQDARVTRVGKYLRASSIDELPQLLNVLNGTMSLVGPRPHAVDHNEDYARKIRGYFSRHRTKPGITGLAQIRGYRGITDTDEKMELRVKSDIEYIENWSPLLDLKILFLTPYAVLSARNAF